MPIIGGGSSQKPTGLAGPGTYVFELLKVEGVKRPRGSKFCDPTKGQHPDDLLDKLLWTFVEQNTGEPIDVLTGLSTTENSTFYSAIGPALNGGVPPCSPGDVFNTDDLLGKRCLAQVQINGAGFAKLTAFTALPDGFGATKTAVKEGVSF